MACVFLHQVVFMPYKQISIETYYIRSFQTLELFYLEREMFRCNCLDMFQYVEKTVL